jgi:RimJ/RimL family protein N-acetyltransferase
MRDVWTSEPVLGDGVVRLRRWALEDLACVEQAAADPHIVEMTTVPAAYSRAEGRAFVERQWGRPAEGAGLSLAIEDVAVGRAVGALSLLHRHGQQAGAVGIGYWIVPAARCRGLATRAVALAAAWALREGGAARVEALVEPSNVGSQRVVETAGFQREGLLRSYLQFADRRGDAVVYSLLPGDESA